MKYLYSLIFLLHLPVSSLYANEQSSGIFELQTLLDITLILVAILIYYIFTLFKKLNDTNGYLEEKTRELHYSKERLDLALKIANLGSWDIDFIKNETIIKTPVTRVYHKGRVVLDKKGLLYKTQRSSTRHPA